MEKIKEETANELLDVLSNFKKSNAEIHANLEENMIQFKELINSHVAQVKAEHALKFAKCALKYANASFLTRWYYDRKLKKLEIKSREIALL